MSLEMLLKIVLLEIILFRSEVKICVDIEWLFERILLIVIVILFFCCLERVIVLLMVFYIIFSYL